MLNKLAAALLAVTAGCAADLDGAFHISGRLADASRVTHVIATNPNTGERVVVDLKSDGLADGEFDVAVPPTGSWIVTFVDASQRGAAMRIATLQAGGVDAFAPTGPGTLDMGKVTFSGARAHGRLAWEDFTAALGHDRETLVGMGKLDDLALRYANPDVDGDGEIDALQDRLFRIGLAGTFRLQTDGRDLSIADLVRGAGNISMRYLGTTIHASVPRAMGMEMETGTVTFEQAFFGTANGPDTEMVPPNTRIGYPHIRFGELAGDPLVGVVAHPSHDAPSGTYRFGFADGTLTFTDVSAPSVAAIAAARDYSVPFVRIRSVAPACVVDCEIAGVDLAWKRATSFGWESAPAPAEARLDIIARQAGEDVHLSVPMTGDTASIAWRDVPTTGSGILPNELSYISSAEICYVAVHYTSELGLEMTSQVDNPGCR